MNSNSKNRNWKRIASVIVLVATAALAVPFLPVAVTDVFAQTEMYGGESDPDATEAPQYDRPVTVEVTRALSRVINQSRAVAGRVEPARTVDIAFQVPGQIISLYVEPGDRIGEGDVIAELEVQRVDGSSRVGGRAGLDQASARHSELEQP